MARGLNLGQDTTIALFGSDGSKISFSTIGGDLISFNPKPKTNFVRRQSISGEGLESRTVEYIAVEGTFVIGRLNGDFEKFHVQAQNRYLGKQDSVRYTITESIQNRDGSNSVTQLRYVNCEIVCQDFGNRAQGEDIRLSFMFEGDKVVQDA